MSTITLRNTKGSALTFTEMDNNFSNLNSDKLEAVVSDTSPQLGGNLDVNGNAIVSTSAGNIAITPDTTGKIILDGLSWPTADGTAGYYLKTDGAGNLSWASVDTDTNTTYAVSAVDSGANAIIRLTGSDASTDDVTLVAGTNITLTPSGDNITIDASATGIDNVVEDTTPQLGGNLDVNGNQIVSTSNGDIRFSPDGTGNIDLNVVDGVIYLDYGTWPSADGSNGQVLTTNGSGTLSWSDAAGGGISNVVEDTTPQLGGTLDANSNDIDMGTNTITDTKVGQWDTAYGWGDHSSAGYISDVVDDTTPQLGGDLDLNSNDITGTGSINITGNVVAQSAINAQTGASYTTVLGDASKLITMSNGSGNTITIPPNSSVAYPVGTKIDIASVGNGQTTVAAGSGVTINATPSLILRAQYSGATCIKTATDTWLLVGDLETP